MGLDRGVRYAGYTPWHGVTAAGVGVHDEAGETWGCGRIFGVVPLSDERVYWFAAESTAAGQHPEDEPKQDEHRAVRERFGDWHVPIQSYQTAAGKRWQHQIWVPVDPEQSALGIHTDAWVEGLHLVDSTIAGYKRIIRNHLRL